MEKRQLIYEPMTAFTDLIITVLGLMFAKGLYEHFSVTALNVHLYWGFAFFMLATGAFFGAVSHGFGPYFSQKVKAILWKITTLSIGIVSVSFLYVLIDYFPGVSSLGWIRWIPFIFYIVYILVIMVNDKFINVIRFYVPVMLLVLLAMLYSQFVMKTAGPGYVSIGILISFIGAGVQASRFDLHKHFNHNDIYHVIQMFGMWFLYKGAMMM
ncbi:MAG: hypothetical protein H8E64_06300 [Candidatus Marinimicrobia bacterium]|nr:hypothetical protein [Candidatus Neomarinimicrobiota bacterium]